MVALLQYGSAILAAVVLTNASPTPLDPNTSAKIVATAGIASRDTPSASSPPYGRKAGSAGGRAVPFWKDHLGWWYDWSPNPKNHPEVPGVSMLWGGGWNGDEDAKRLKEFQQMTGTPKYLLGFNEPDCTQRDVSSNMSPADAARDWNKYIAPKGKNGALLGSPSMCSQKDEHWLRDFNKQRLDRSWDFTAIHVYKPDMQGVQADIDYYWNTYKKPIWITEFACVYDQDGFRPCSDQGQINKWIRDAVDLFEKNSHVMAYAYTDGGGLGNAWLPTNNQGTALSESGRTYLDAIRKYH